MGENARFCKIGRINNEPNHRSNNARLGNHLFQSTQVKPRQHQLECSNFSCADACWRHRRLFLFQLGRRGPSGWSVLFHRLHWYHPRLSPDANSPGIPASRVTPIHRASCRGAGITGTSMVLGPFPPGSSRSIRQGGRPAFPTSWNPVVPCVMAGLQKGSKNTFITGQKVHT